jgi:hypothetical protein
VKVKEEPGDPQIPQQISDRLYNVQAAKGQGELTSLTTPSPRHHFFGRMFECRRVAHSLDFTVWRTETYMQ